MTPELDSLRHASASDAERFFATVDPESLVRAVHAAADDELLGLIGRDDVRRAAVTGILARFQEYAVPERLAQVEGVVRFDLGQDGALLERHGLALAGGRADLAPDLPADAAVDVVLRSSVLLFVRVVAGQRNAGLEFLAGTLDIEGDAGLALAVGGLFRVPGSDSVAVDPTSLDPVDVATALRGVDPAHLARVMTSGFRPVVLEEIFRRLPQFVNPRRARSARLCVGFRLLGNPSGEVERWTVAIDHGTTTITRGSEGERRDATVTCEAHDFLRLATGHLSAVSGVLRGQLKVRGDRAKALQLSSIIDIPTARS